MKITIHFLLFFFLSCIASQATAKEIQTTSSIEKAVHSYISSNIILGSDFKIQLGQIDSRLKLPLCLKPLTAFTHQASIKPGRNSIGIKCDSKNKWTVYTRAIIHIYKNVIVLSTPVRRGEILTKTMLSSEKREISSLRTGFITNIDSILNKQANRNLGIGSVLTKANITEPKLIKRGEKITIKASIPNLDISMAGIAMMDGIKGQNIRVKNIKTKQIVHATVIKQGHVVVVF